MALRRSELRRTAELQPGAPLRRTELAASVVPIRRNPPKRQPRTRSERDPEWAPARRVALDRDGNRCARCGHRATEVHHRVALGMGGSSDPDRHRADRLVSLCAADHKWVHDEVDAAKATGYIVLRPQDAWTVPVHTIDGPRWLTPTGVVLAA